MMRTSSTPDPLNRPPATTPATPPAGAAGGRAGHPAADEHHRHVVVLRLPLDHWEVRILEVVGELSLQLEVLVVAIRPQPLGPLLGVLLAERFLVHGPVLGDLTHGSSLPRARDRVLVQ